MKSTAERDSITSLELLNTMGDASISTDLREEVDLHK